MKVNNNAESRTWSREWLERWTGKVADRDHSIDGLDQVVQDERGCERTVCSDERSGAQTIYGQGTERFHDSMVQRGKDAVDSWQLGSKRVSKGDLITTTCEVFLYDVDKTDIRDTRAKIFNARNTMICNKGSLLIFINLVYDHSLSQFTVKFLCDHGILGMQFFEQELFWKTYKLVKQ